MPKIYKERGLWMEYTDIRDKPGEEKEKVYCQIQARYLTGKPVSMKEHKSGFPAVTVDCEDIHILTDILSIEQWWGKLKEREVKWF